MMLSWSGVGNPASGAQSGFLRAGQSRSPVVLGIVLLHLALLWALALPRHFPAQLPQRYLQIWRVIEHPKHAPPAAHNPPIVPNLPKVAQARPVRAQPQAARPPRARTHVVSPEPPAPVEPVRVDANRAEPAATDTASKAASTPSPSGVLDADKTRAILAGWEKTRERSPLEKVHEAEHRDRSLEKRLGEGVQRAKRADCEHAYSGFGLLAVIPLAIDAVRDDGCKW